MEPMSFRAGVIARLTAIFTACVIGLSACGGGGGGSDPDDPPGGPGGSTLSGRLWHQNFALDSVDGSQIASPTGEMPVTVDSNEVARPWPDGSQYAIYEYDGGAEQTKVVVKATASGEVLYEVLFEGYVRDLKPSPAEKHKLLVTWSDDFSADADLVFVDLRAETVLDQLPAASGVIDWLPDGRFVHLNSAGQVSTGVVGAARTTTGQVDLEGQVPNSLAVNRQGTAFAVVLDHLDSNGDPDDRDIWVADIDGGNAARFTDSGMTNYARWSPDGASIAFDIDPGTLCSGSACSGGCELWYADATARAIDPTSGAPGEAGRFSVKNRQGQDKTLGCELLAWTD